ncbi:hypothetical protein ATSB10_10190 [Dyella thiooxydans]|uniref:Uncharacterized protein n=1 Tax=Dyella thiooxydans TaxID=445710 RepID=A0A160MYP3_9GAMM|nr:hypothetical protein ATSB10_10190 [Dyella thiooxydans]
MPRLAVSLIERNRKDRVLFDATSTRACAGLHGRASIFSARCWAKRTQTHTVHNYLFLFAMRTCNRPR